MSSCTRPNLIRASSGLLAASAIALASPASAQVLIKDLPQIQNVGITLEPGTPVPLNLEFADAAGNTVRVSDWFDGKRPVLLVLAYYECPLLCTLVLNRTQAALNSLKWTAGKDFRVVTVSFDFRDTPESAREKQELYHAGYNRSPGDDGWLFLTGTTENIRALTRAVGYNYKYLPETSEFSHPSALIFLTPDGLTHNFIERLEYPPAEVKLALTEAAQGKIGTIFDRVQHYCFPYNPMTGQYTAQVMNIMRIGAVGVVVVLGAFIGVLVLKSRRSRATKPAETSQLGAVNGSLTGGSLTG